jgi:Protein of unknown function (DUF2829)
MDFGGAIHCILGGDFVYRESWARGIFLALEKPDDHSQMTEPYLYIQEGESDAATRYPWIPRHEDMLASDWVMLPS